APSHLLVILARVRQWLAAAILLVCAVHAIWWQVEVYRYFRSYYAFDPAPIFYLAGAVGLALRVFWARYLAICFAVAIVTIQLWGPDPLPTLACGAMLVAILSGRTMRDLFEGRHGRLNRWAADVDRRVARLRILFIAQSVALALLFAARFQLSG